MSSYSIKLLPIQQAVTVTPAEWQIILLFAELGDFDKLVNTLRTTHNIELKTIEATLLGLQKKGVIQLSKKQVEDAGAEIPALFWETINIELSKSIGPIASIVIDDSIDEFSYSRDSFPQKLLFSFVEKVSNEISSSAEKNQFQKTMLNFIKQNI